MNATPRIVFAPILANCSLLFIVHSILNPWPRRDSNPLYFHSIPSDSRPFFVDFWPLSTTYHNTQAVLTIRCAVASAFVGYCFRVSSPTTRKVDCITVHYTLLPVLLSLFLRLQFACYYYSRATIRLHRGLCGDVPATKFTLFVGARFTQGSRFFTLPHGCLIALLGNSFTWLHYLATYCTISRGAALCATFIHMVFAFVLRLILPTLCLAVYINSNNSLLPVLYLFTHTVCANNTQAKFSSWQLSP